MLKRFSAKGFRCLRDLQVDLEPLTVLIGPNDSGKSSILECMATLGRVCRHELSNLKYFQGRYDLAANLSKGGATKSLELSASYDNPSGAGDRVDYAVAIGREERGFNLESEVLKYGKKVVHWSKHKGQGTVYQKTEGTRGGPQKIESMPHRIETFGKSKDLPPKIRKLVEPLGSIESYSLRTEALGRPCKSTLEPVMGEDGEGLSAVLESFALAEHERFRAIQEALCRFSPLVKELKIRPVGSEKDVQKLVHAVLADGVEVAANMLSDGLLYTLGYLTLLHGTRRPFALLVEEPENGIHPENLETIMGFFRGVSEGTIGGGPVQVVISTHSPYLLDLAQPQEVRIVTRTMEEGTRVSTMDSVKGLRDQLREFKLGEYHCETGTA